MNVDATYALEDLGIGIGLAINASGDVAGLAPLGTTSEQAMLWVGSTAIPLGVPFGDRARANGINDSQTLVGETYDTQHSVFYGFIWKAGVFTILVPPNGGLIRVAGINNLDEVVGSFEPGHAFRYTTANGYMDLHPSGYVESLASAISDEGVVVGQVTLSNHETHAAMWSATNVFTDLGTLGGKGAGAYDVNNSGFVAGTSRDGISGHGTLPFVWHPSLGGMVAVGTRAVFTGISDKGRMVGYKESGKAITQFQRTASVVLPNFPGWTIGYAWGVNRCGTVTGYAQTSDGLHAVRWRKPTCD